MFKVRFHLASGSNYMQWQVKKAEVQYYDPAQFSLIMTGCTLKNHRSTAQRIHGGENKTVCAWINCESVTIIQGSPSDSGDPICYNPKKLPYWTDITGQQNLDGNRYDRLVTIGKRIMHTPL